MSSNKMERLGKIIVKKFLTNGEQLKPPDRLTDEEYQLVKNCQLDDLLKCESRPAALDRICEGEKVQTTEYYQQKEKKFERDFAKLYRKTAKRSRPHRAVRQVVPSGENQTAPDVNPPPPTKGDNEPSVQHIATEGAMEPTRSNESKEPPNDPYQLREEITPIPIVMPLAVLPEDENFGSNDVDGARDFLQLCTGEVLPPMSMRQTMTREMLLSQLPSIPSVPPLVDNFQELDWKSINTPMFKRPLKTSTPLVTGQDAQIPLPAVPDIIAEETVGGPIEDPTGGVPPNTVVETAPTTDQPGPSARNSGPSSAKPAAIVEASSSSTNLSDTPAPRRRRTPQEIPFTERLAPFEMKTVAVPRARRSFDIFSFPCHAIWNKAIQDVQNHLSESYQQLQLVEKTIMREAVPEQRIDSGFQQTSDELAHRPPTISVTERSNLVTINQVDEPNVPSIQQDTLMTPDMVASMQPNEPDALAAIDGQLTEVSDRFALKSFAEGTSTRHEKTATTEQLAPVEAVSVLKESSKDNVTEPVVATDTRSKKKPKRGNRVKKTKSVQNENDPIPDVSSVLFDQAKELETVSDNNETVVEMSPIDPLVVDILLAVQGAMNDEEELGHPLSIQRLRQLLRINSRLDASKLLKNVILLKQAGLLAVECNAENQIVNVSFKLPEVDDDDIH